MTPKGDLLETEVLEYLEAKALADLLAPMIGKHGLAIAKDGLHVTAFAWL